MKKVLYAQSVPVTPHDNSLPFLHLSVHHVVIRSIQICRSYSTFKVLDTIQNHHHLATSSLNESLARRLHSCAG